MTVDKEKLERIQSIASIISSIAIPLVLAVTGYFVQRQFADEGLKKDYVSIAAGILKDDPTKQEPDLRKWAVNVLDSNSPIPFSNKAKDGLLQGIPIFNIWPALPPPIEDCMTPPKKRTVSQEIKKLVKQIENSDTNTVLDAFSKFALAVEKEERIALENAARLACMQDWANIVVNSDNKYRKEKGMESSKSVFDRLNKEEKEAKERAGTSVEKSQLPALISSSTRTKH